MSVETIQKFVQLAVPIAIFAAAMVPLTASGALETVTSVFFEGFNATEQMALLALLYSIVYMAVVGSQLMSQGSTAGSSSKPAPKIDYPLAEMAKHDAIKDKFKCIFPMLRSEMMQHMKDNEMTAEAVVWAEKMMDYSVPGGKLNRGTTVVSVHQTLLRRELSPTETARASVLGWAIEFLQAFFLVADDVMDESQTRRGQPCWYKQPHVQLIAINDSFLLESYVFTILEKHFGHETYYNRLVSLFLDVIQKTEFGQLLDLTSQPMETKAIDLSRFTLERYQLIVKYKTAFYTFYLPIAIGMITSGVTSDEAFQLARNICCIMGEYFQIQDDYLDCFGAPEVIGKIGTDIQDNKCSWLVVQALIRATPAQKKVLEQNYGKWDDKKVAKVKALYTEMDLPKVFADYEEESYKKIQAELDKVTLMPRDVFELLLKKIYKRNK